MQQKGNKFIYVPWMRFSSNRSVLWNPHAFSESESVKIQFRGENLKIRLQQEGRLSTTGADLSVKLEEISGNNFSLLKQVVR